jgi:hypothetical protein
MVHNSNTIIKFADDNSGRPDYRQQDILREVVRDLAVWCQDKNLSLNVSKT